MAVIMSHFVKNWLVFRLSSAIKVKVLQYNLCASSLTCLEVYFSSALVIRPSSGMVASNLNDFILRPYSSET